MTPTARCVLLVGTIPGLEAMSNPLLGTICYRSVGFALTGGINNDHALAVTLRELANMLDVPTAPDPDLI